MANRVLDIVRGNHLTHYGTPVQGTNGLAPYVQYDGGLNVSMETAPSLRGVYGFTVGGWFQATSNDCLMSVWNPTGNNRVWRLFVNVLTPTLYVSNNGTTTFSVAAGVPVVSGQWFHVIGRYTPSTELSIFLNGVKYSFVSGTVPTTLLNNGFVDFAIGANSAAAEQLTGKASMCFFSAVPIQDALARIIFETSRNFYGI